MHGAYSPRFRSERQDEIVAELLAMPHVVPELDLPAAREIAALTVQVERVDAALADGRVENKKGDVRSLMEHRRRLAAQLHVLHESFGMTPRSRWTFARALASGAELAARLRALEEGED